MRLAHQLSIAAGLIAVAVSAVGIMPAHAHDGWKHRHKHHHHDYYAPPGHVRYYSAPRVIYERPVVYREAPVYYAPSGPPSLNLIIPLR
ncbi:hypothetical protein [Reyranella sp.]|uniref:hypothetical protein n=1 Tax=Reyranella sp. TaxID=1929291 RepID=UPI003D0EF911